MGLATARLIAARAGWPTLVTAGSIFCATGVSIAGLVSGMYRALRAWNLNPIEAVCYEWPRLAVGRYSQPVHLLLSLTSGNRAAAFGLRREPDK